jgi:hypothetical protein
VIQTMILGADVDVADWEGGKSLLVTHPSGQQYVIPLTGEQELVVRSKLSDLALPPGGVAPMSQAS